MTIEFWPRRLLEQRPRPLPKFRQRRPRRPKLPIGVGKAHQILSSAVILGDHELASWLDLAVKRDLVTGKPEQLQELKQRLDAVMEPLPDVSPPSPLVPEAGGLPAADAVPVP
jgi:hypothetical protein